MAIKTYVQSDLRVPPTDGNHLVRLRDMISYVSGLTKEAVRVVSTAPLAGAYDSTAKTLTLAAVAQLIIDGIILVVGDRLLLVAQLDLTQNGIYVITDLGDGSTTPVVLTRAEDFDDSTDIINGTIVPASDGTVNGGTHWKLTPATIPAVLDTTNLIFTKQVSDTKRVTELIFDIEGDDTTTDFPVSHSLGTMNVTHEIYDSTTGETVVAQFTRLDINTAQVDFGVPPATGEEFTLILRAEVEPS